MKILIITSNSNLKDRRIEAICNNLKEEIEDFYLFAENKSENSHKLYKGIISNSKLRWKEFSELNNKLGKFPQSFSLIFRHGSDCYKNPSVKQFSAPLKIVYSGSGIAEKNVNKKEEELINRVVDGNDENSYLSKKELKVLIDYSKGGAIPRCLIDKEKERTLATKINELNVVKYAENITKGFSNFDAEKKKILIITWDDSFPAHFGDLDNPTSEKSLLFNKLKEDIFKDASIIEFCQSKKEFDDISNANLYDLIFLVHIEVRDKAANIKFYQSNYGLKLIRELRIKGRQCPIVYGTVQEEKNIQSEDRLGLLYTPGIYYLNLLAPKEIVEFFSISEITLRDISASVLSIVGRYHELFHNTFQKDWRKKDWPAKTVINNIFSKIAQLFPNQYSQNYLELETLKGDILEEVGESTCSMYDDLKLASYKNLIKDKLAFKSNSEENKEHQVQGKWQVLYMEDSDEDYANLEQEFKRNKINCIRARNKKEVYEELDKNKNITILVCDWRIFKQGTNKVWENDQGLDVVNDIASSSSRFPHMLSFFIVTDKEGGIIREAQHHFSFRTYWYSKANLANSLVRADFLEKVTKEGNANINLEENLRSTAWNKESRYSKISLKKIYTYYKKTASYPTDTKTLNEKAVKFINAALQCQRDRQKVSLLDLGLSKEEVLYGETIKDTDDSKKQITEKQITILKKRLLPRRVAIVLAFKRWNKLRIHEFLNQRTFDSFPINDNTANAFLSKICLGDSILDIIVDNILNEEYYFLKDFYPECWNQLTLIRRIKPEKQFNTLCKRIYENILANEPKLAVRFRIEGIQGLKDIKEKNIRFLTVLEGKKNEMNNKVKWLDLITSIEKQKKDQMIMDMKQLYDDVIVWGRIHTEVFKQNVEKLNNLFDQVKEDQQVINT